MYVRAEVKHTIYFEWPKTFILGVCSLYNGPIWYYWTCHTIRPFQLLSVFRITLTDRFWADFIKKKDLILFFFFFF